MSFISGVIKGAAGCGLVVAGLVAAGSVVNSGGEGPSERLQPMFAEEDLSVDDIRVQKVLADGMVTESEYTGTIDVVVRCANEKGASIDPENFVREVRGQRSYVMPENKQAPEALDSCYNEHAFAIDLLYQTHPSAIAASREEFTAIESCLVRWGLDVAEAVERDSDGIPEGTPQPDPESYTAEDRVRIAEATFLSGPDRLRAEEILDKCFQDPDAR